MYQDGEWLCGQALEFDLSVQGTDILDLYRKIERAVLSHIAVRLAHGKRPFADLPPAAKKFEDMYNASKIVLPRQLIRLRANITPPQVRVAAAVGQ
jgi:hypothetical protein